MPSRKNSDRIPLSKKFTVTHQSDNELFRSSSSSVGQHDVVVTGGGPAGLATALAVRAKGLRVVVVDAAYPPLDKACGEGLMIDSLRALRGLGVDLTAEEGMPFRGIRFLGTAHKVEAEFPAGVALGVRRTTLHKKLVERAESAGVDLRWGYPLRGLQKDALICQNARFVARWIVGADGLQSNIRRWAGLNRFVWNRERIGMRQHFAVKPWSDHVDVHWGERCQCYVTPIGPEEVSVAFLHQNRQAGFSDLLRLFPEVADRIGGARPTSSARGALTALRRIRRIYKGNVALVGDASGAVDAITGQGMGLAFQQAAALAEALAAGDLRQYARRHSAIMWRPTLMAAGLSIMGEHARLREVVLKILTKKPLSFDRLLALHLGLKV